MCLCSGGVVFGPGLRGSLMVQTAKGRDEHSIIFLINSLSFVVFV